MKWYLKSFIILLVFGVRPAAFSQSFPKYEFRAVWVATVDNIDWPYKKNLSTAEQKAEFIHLLDMHKHNGMNAVIVQIRPVADAFYPSKYEPWSEFLNGQQGLAPVPYYDPLQFMIEETHKRGMEFHAWINPYRAALSIRSSSVSPAHVTRLHPNWFLNYGDKKYFDPGRPQVMQYVATVVKDIVTRYDVDAIHMDDYFYPYRIAGREFPDYKSYAIYGNGLPKSEWRRSNCDSIIKLLHETILSVKPMVKFGISPFGVWRNKSQDTAGSDTRAAVTNYDDLYANVLLWLKQGWIDYVTPQLYWEIGHPTCDYETLLTWWAGHSYGKHVYIGHGFYRSVEKPNRAWRNHNELPDEINYLRENQNIQGSVFYRSKYFESNPNGWSDSLRINYYKYPSLIPPMPWVDTIRPLQPVITNALNDSSTVGSILRINGTAYKSKTEVIKNYVLYLSNNSATLGSAPAYISVADTTNFSFNVLQAQIPTSWNNCFAAVSCVDKENNESFLSNIVQYIKTDKGWALKN